MTIADAVAALKNGGLVAFPTETVYGLGADATNKNAILKIYQVKNRPVFNPLIVHCSSVEQMRGYCEWEERAEALANAFMPGPLTIIVQRWPWEKFPAPDALAVAEETCAKLPTIALRMPNHPVALDLIEQYGKPLAAPSANPSGMLSPTRAAHVRQHLADSIDVILEDTNPCRIGLESTIVDIGMGTSGWELLRQGAISQEQIEAVLKMPPNPKSDEIRSPGQLLRHYTTHKDLVLDVTTPALEDALLAFGEVPHPAPKHTLNLSPAGNLEEAASRLFAYLHLLDKTDASRIVVMPIPEEGIGMAINERLRRGAVRPY
jgi:L-threonylcarbamoyladenylate synthase